jgi:hypothetical protein
MSGLYEMAWRKSSYSAANGCVEVAPLDNYVAVRDSKDRNANFLVFTRFEWRDFLQGIYAGEFDMPDSASMLDVASEPQEVLPRSQQRWATGPL